MGFLVAVEEVTSSHSVMGASRRVFVVAAWSHLVPVIPLVVRDPNSELGMTHVESTAPPVHRYPNAVFTEVGLASVNGFHARIGTVIAPRYAKLPHDVSVVQYGRDIAMMYVSRIAKNDIPVGIGDVTLGGIGVNATEVRLAEIGGVVGSCAL